MRVTSTMKKARKAEVWVVCEFKEMEEEEIPPALPGLASFACVSHGVLSGGQQAGLPVAQDDGSSSYDAYDSSYSLASIRTDGQVRKEDKEVHHLQHDCLVAYVCKHGDSV